MLISKSRATSTLEGDIRGLSRDMRGRFISQMKQGRWGGGGSSKAERFGTQAVASATWVSNSISVFPCDGYFTVLP